MDLSTKFHSDIYSFISSANIYWVTIMLVLEIQR